MAGLTTASLVSLYDPIDSVSLHHDSSTKNLATYLGLPSQIQTRPLISLLSTAFLSISFLVFLNTAQAFVLTSLLEVPSNKVGGVTGNLILTDEILSLFLVLFYGALIDRIGVRKVAVWGHVIVGLALIGFVNVYTIWPGLISMRLLYATGASALVTSLTAGLSLISSYPSSSPSSSSPAPAAATTPSAAAQYASNHTSDERQPLLVVEPSEIKFDAVEGQNSGAKVAGLIGFAAGCGALLAVFGYLRLPPFLATRFPSFPLPTIDDDEGEALKRGLRLTFYTVATLAFMESIFLYFNFNLVSSTPPPTFDASENNEVELTTSQRLRAAFVDLGLGFKIGVHDSDATLAYLAGFTSRAGSLVVAAFIPLYINNYFFSHDLCTTSPLSDLAPTTCRPSLILASTLTGITQLTSLLLSPIIGSITPRLLSTPLLLFLTLLLGSTAFALFAFLPSGDPRTPFALLASIGFGLSQVGGLVGSLGLISRVRDRAVIRHQGKEVGGAISGAYSFCGGMGILILGKVGGKGFDEIGTGAPFGMMAGINFVVAGFAGFVWIQERRRSSSVGRRREV